MPPGVLSRAMRWQASRGRIHLGSTRTENRHLAVRARASLEAFSNDVHSLLQVEALNPAAPKVMNLIREASIE